MRAIPVTSLARRPQAEIDRLAADLRRHATVEDLLAWWRAQALPRDLANVVVQDEFTHDLVVEAGDGLVAVYDTT